MLQVCLNGDWSPRERVPVTPVELAESARAAVRAGASAIHVHPRGDLGRESLDGSLVVRTLAAIRELVPGVPVGVSTREAICPDPRERLALVRQWPSPEDGGPDFASVNWHELGSVEVARMLRARGIGVEAGIWTPRAASAFIGSHWPWQVERVLVEAIPGHTPGSDPVWAVERILTALGMQPAPVLAHGEGRWTWPLLRWAQKHRYAIRIGLEDTLVDEAGLRVRTNAELVSAACAVHPR
jgi:uncharacterized protein (DUF849 family)